MRASGWGSWSCAHRGWGVCVQSVGRGANRGLSLREGVLAKASAVRPRATPRTFKGHTDTTDTEQTTHTLRGVLRNRTLFLIHSFIHSFVRSFVRSFIHSIIQASHSGTRGTRTHSETRNTTRALHSRLLSKRGCTSARFPLPPPPFSVVPPSCRYVTYVGLSVRSAFFCVHGT